MFRFTFYYFKKFLNPQGFNNIFFERSYLITSTCVLVLHTNSFLVLLRIPDVNIRYDEFDFNSPVHPLKGSDSRRIGGDALMSVL